MGHLVRFIVNELTTLSVFVSMATYYLAVNKTWQVKHERAVATSISIASYGVYLFTTTFFILNMLMTSAPWQTIAETTFALGNTLFLLAIGLGWWVPGERAKGPWRLLSESLRSERRHLGALAQALTHPANSRRIIDILTQIAMIDGTADDREKAFIQLFADAWDIHVDWDEVVRRAATTPGSRYAQLRLDVEAYLRTAPPKAQALQLADLVVRLTRVDEDIAEAEALISSELGALLEQYGDARERTAYEVHLIPQSSEQVEAMMAAFPQLPRRMLASGPIAVAATCYSREYAEFVRSQYESPNLYVAVACVDVGSSPSRRTMPVNGFAEHRPASGEGGPVSGGRRVRRSAEDIGKTGQ